MDLLPIGCSFPCHFGSYTLKIIERRLNSKQPKFLLSGKHNISSSISKSSYNLRESYQDSYKNENLHEKDGHRLLSFIERLHSQDVAVRTDGTCNYHVADGDTGLRNIPRKLDQCENILIPSLPNTYNGDNCHPITSCFWEWKPKLSVHYEMSGTENIGAPGVLFLPGFGVGAFHYEKQLKDLGRDYRVWSMDFLGQGLSLPSEDPAPLSKLNFPSQRMDSKWGFGNESEPWAAELVYSVDLWREQVQHFIEQVIGEPVYIVGNSLGGFVAVYFAAFSSQLVKGVTLLNATPFWGFLPNPTRSPIWSKIFPWAGTFPLPLSVRILMEFVWQKISDPSNIEEILKQVYADHTTKVDKVFSHIVEITQHPAAAAAFASIMFAPRGQLSFQEALIKCELQNVPICLMYGKDDPWVRPIWGLQVKRQAPETPYYEISPAGHCPHDEVPEVVNFLLRGWIKSLESRGSISLPLLEESTIPEISFSRVLEYVKEEGSQKSVQVRFFGTEVSLWDQISSFLSSDASILRPNVR
ncbi:hypothetical protein AXF42_Ash012304 [Apostasia shenzhenica]|uniref:AB hydrolase-1 domain-containing protein n=1 Tax=Apostasia shenzhenica TaxID=1088818 RepID=A0A2I0ACV6_9ASPA|nr:hypothetical protein AXF42_Ash012304 [Apostasia shenzhenica]